MVIFLQPDKKFDLGGEQFKAPTRDLLVSGTRVIISTSLSLLPYHTWIYTLWRGGGRVSEGCVAFVGMRIEFSLADMLCFG